MHTFFFKIEYVILDIVSKSSYDLNRHRLTLLDAKTKRPLADELFDKKDPETVEQFLLSNFDTSKPIFIVTDFYSSYPSILKKVFGKNLIHQYCLLHFLEKHGNHLIMG